MIQLKQYTAKKSCGIGLFLLLLFATFLCGCGKKEEERKVASLNDLQSPKYRFGVMTGIVATREAQARFTQAEFMEYPMPIDAFTAICSGRVDAVVLDRPTLEFMVLAHPELAVMKEDLAIGHISVAAAKRSTKLMQQVNEFIRKYRADGTYQQMYERWFHTKNSDMPELPQPERPKGTLKVGVTANNEPMCFIKDGNLAGFDSEFSIRLAASLNKEIEFKDIPYDALVTALESGKIDLAVAQMDAMPEREESVLFSKEYIDSPITVMIRKELYAGGGLTTFQDLEGKKVGTLTGSAFDSLAKNYMPDYKLFSYSQVNQQVAALESGKIDAFFIDEPMGRFMLLQRQKLTAMQQKIPCGDYAYMFSKQNPELCEKFSGEIRKMRESGELKRLEDKWFSLDAGNQTLPEVLKNGSPLKFAAAPEFQPFVYISNGKIVGYDAEIAILAANRLGYSLEFMPTDISSIVELVNTGKADIAGGCVTITKERQESVLFGEPTYLGGISLIIRKEQPEHAVELSFTEKISAFGLSLCESFNKTFIRESRWLLILQGLGTTILITVCSVILGTLLAFPVCMMCRSRRKLASWLGDRYVSFIMGTPLLVILMLLYYVVFAKVDISGVIVAILAFGMDFAAYTSVTLRAGIDGIPRGQTEAALALGHTPMSAFLRIVLPQAVRSVLPVYRSEIISTLKSTSIVGYIAIMDLTKMGDIIRSRTYEAFFPLIAIAVIYFLVAKCLTAILLVLEDKLNPERRRDVLLQKEGAK